MSLVLLAVLVPLSALCAWVDLEIDDTDRYVAAVAPLASDPGVRDTVSDLITDAALKQIDTGPLQGTIEDFLHDAVRSFTGTETFRAAWTAANSTAHQAVTASLDGDRGEAVTIDLAPVTEKVKQNLVRSGVPFADQIPVQHIEITLIPKGRADQLRDTFRWMRDASVWPGVGTAALAVVAVVAAGVRRGWRGALNAMVVAGFGFAIGAVVLRVLLAVARGKVLSGVPDSDHDGAAAVYDALTDSLLTTVWIVLGTGLAVALCALVLRYWPARSRRTRQPERAASRP
ncbi:MULTISPECIES: hypothetical protein [unclassified Streptomyces]|uniref:hypothetical protein n=1 Tax=Streptomyces sp. DT24 TaxID=3416520 RepID=UPI003CF83CB4